MDATTTQNEAILRHLQAGKAITPIEALELYGCFRLGARIYDLKRKGHEIKRETVERGGKRFARYSM